MFAQSHLKNCNAIPEIKNKLYILRIKGNRQLYSKTNSKL